MTDYLDEEIRKLMATGGLIEKGEPGPVDGCSFCQARIREQEMTLSRARAALAEAQATLERVREVSGEVIRIRDAVVCAALGVGRDAEKKTDRKRRWWPW